MTKVLVVDDSALMRRLLGEVFGAAGGFDVAFARSGREALDLAATFRPDVVTLDQHMPGMDGLEMLDRLMLEQPCPVVMVSSLTAAGADVTLQALRLGAVDFVAKPTGAVSMKMQAFGPVLVEKVRAAVSAKLRRSHRLVERVRLTTRAMTGPAEPAAASGRAAARQAPLPAQEDQAGERPARARVDGLVLIGTSTGGPPALDAVLSGLPAGFRWPILVAQHMPASFTGPLARRLDGICALAVSEVTAPVRLAPGHVYLAHGDADIVVGTRTGVLVALPAPADPDRRWHPSVGRLVETAMQHVPPERLVGVLMTGMGNDGAQAMTQLRAAGGRTIAEAEETAIVWGMPGELVRAGGADAIEPLDAISDRLLAMLGS